MSEHLIATLSHAAETSARNMESLVTICLFSGVGLLLSLLVLLLDQHIPAEWF